MNTLKTLNHLPIGGYLDYFQVFTKITKTVFIFVYKSISKLYFHSITQLHNYC